MYEVETLNRALNEIGKVLKGKEEVVRRVMTVFLAKGHILLEDIPGVGKTTLAIAFSKVLNLESKRMQFTPDVLPSDIIGFHMINKDKEMEYCPGPVFTNIFLADEINRTSSKTQSALLEVMEEGCVTIDGCKKVVPELFTVIATQNPIGSAGTQKLPESQLDRFMVKLTMGYPDIQNEINILKSKQQFNPMELVKNVFEEKDLKKIQDDVTKIFVHDSIYEYIAKLVEGTRKNGLLDLGVSPRGTLALAAMAKADAYMNGNEFVIPENVGHVFEDVVSHRFILSTRAKLEHMNEKMVAQNIFKRVKPPRIG